MTKRVIVSLIAALALVLTATASAAISITQAPAGPGYQNLSPYNCDGKTFYLFSSGADCLSIARGVLQTP